MGENDTSTTYRKVIAHFGGGLRGDFKSGTELRLFPIDKDKGVIVKLKVPFHCSPVLSDLALIQVGDEEILYIDDLPLRIWHPYCVGTPGKFGADSLPNQWLAIADSAAAAGDAESAEVLRHVSFALAAAGYRLRDISDAYAFQLEYALTRGIGEDQLFANLEVFNLYLTCHSFLV